MQQNRSAEDHSLHVQITAPSGSFWSLLAFDQAVDGSELMSDVLESMVEQYESVESSEAAEQMVEHSLAGFDTFFYCLDLLVTNRMRFLQSGDSRMLLMYQAENREFDEMEPVFNAITVGMLTDLKEGKRLRLSEIATE